MDRQRVHVCGDGTGRRLRTGCRGTVVEPLGAGGWIASLHSQQVAGARHYARRHRTGDVRLLARVAHVAVCARGHIVACKCGNCRLAGRWRRGDWLLPECTGLACAAVCTGITRAHAARDARSRRPWRRSPAYTFMVSRGSSVGPVGTITSKSDPFTRDSDSSPSKRRSGAIDISQSLPLSATNMP